jgi:hypothetical protein
VCPAKPVNHEANESYEKQTIIRGDRRIVFFADRDAISQPAPLEITEQPISVEANVGSSLAFFMSVTGSGAYRWQFKGRDFPRRHPSAEDSISARRVFCKKERR